MKVAIFSDLHDNYGALERVPSGLDRSYCLGDICEDNPESARKCIEKLQELGAECVLGRHDRAIFSDDDRNYFAEQARAGHRKADNHRNLMNAERMRRTLGGEYIEWLKKWEEPVKEVELGGGYRMVMVHDSLERLSEEESLMLGLGGLYKSRIVSPELAKRNFDSRFFNLLVVGHTHMPMMWEDPETPKVSVFSENNSNASLSRWGRYIICPGSMCGDSGLSIVPHAVSSSGLRRDSFGVLSYDDDSDTILLDMKFHSEKRV